MHFSPKRLAGNEVLKSVFRLAIAFTCIWILEQHKGGASFPIRRPDILLLVPAAIATFFKRNDRPFWFFWGIAVGGFVMHFIGD